MKSEIFLIDTGIWIEYFHRGNTHRNRKIIEEIKGLEKGSKVVTCGIILAEFIQGLGRSQKELSARRILENHECLATSKEIYILAGELSRSLTQKGFRTPLSDCLIGVVAIAFGVVLVSSDPHFKQFPDLKLRFL